MFVTRTGELRFRHSEPGLVDRVEDALRKNRLPNEFLPEPTTFKGALWGTGATNGQDRLRYEWRDAHWGCWQMATEPVERIDPCTVKAQFEAASYAPIALLQRMIELGYSIEGTWVDDSHTCAERYDNGIVTSDPDGFTLDNMHRENYLEECALRGDTPVLDERGKPDLDAAYEYFARVYPKPPTKPVAVEKGALSYFKALAA